MQSLKENFALVLGVESSFIADLVKIAEKDVNEVLKILCDPKITVLKKGSVCCHFVFVFVFCLEQFIQYTKNLRYEDLNKNFI